MTCTSTSAVHCFQRKDFGCAPYHRRVSQAALPVAPLCHLADHVTTGQVRLDGLPCDA
jgi:hypothetical protein